LTIHVDGLRYQPSAVERAEAIERTESSERSAASDNPVSQSAAAGATASRKRKPR
jgi:hypothetical protein